VGTAVVRACHNTPPGWCGPASAIAGGAAAGADDIAVGRVDSSRPSHRRDGPERQLGRRHRLSGSGPAYVLLVAEAMIAAGRTPLGLPNTTSAIDSNSDQTGDDATSTR